MRRVLVSTRESNVVKILAAERDEPYWIVTAEIESIVRTAARLVNRVGTLRIR